MNMNKIIYKIQKSKRPYCVIISIITIWSFLFSNITVNYSWANGDGAAFAGAYAKPLAGPGKLSLNGSMVGAMRN